jgi:hypothetical protein
MFPISSLRVTPYQRLGTLNKEEQRQREEEALRQRINEHLKVVATSPDRLECVAAAALVRIQGTSDDRRALSEAEEQNPSK